MLFVNNEGGLPHVSKQLLIYCYSNCKRQQICMRHCHKWWQVWTVFNKFLKKRKSIMQQWYVYLNTIIQIIYYSD